MGFYGIKQDIAENLYEIANIEKRKPTDLSMLAMLAGIENPHRRSFGHYFKSTGQIVHNGFNGNEPEHKTVWELLDKHQIPYNKHVQMRCGQALGVMGISNHFEHLMELITKIDFDTGIPIVHDIFIIKNEKNPPSYPKFISKNESCDRALDMLRRFFPDKYARIEGHEIYYSNNYEPVTGRNDDFAVFMALWNAIHNKPAKQGIFAGKISLYGDLEPTIIPKVRYEAARDLDMPLVVGPENFVELTNQESLATVRKHNMDFKDIRLVESLSDLLVTLDNHPALDEAALEKINAYKPIVKQKRIFMLGWGMAGLILAYDQIN
jgi:hypothetical protein